MASKKSIIFFLAIFLLLASIAYAHQPRIVSDEFTQIINPEISQAFYGNLHGKPHIFQIKSDTHFKLYAGVLVPDLPGIDKDVSAEAKSENNTVFVLDGPNHNWTQFYEEFGGDNYYKGPEKEIEGNPGTYDIIVSSPDNKGKYVLVVGKIESFPLNEALNTLFVLPQLKKNFFNKSPLTAFFNLIGVFLLIMLLALIGIILLAIWIIRKAMKN